MINIAKLPKCPDCKIEIEDKSKATKKGSRWVCESCTKVRDQVTDTRQSLYEYIAKIFNIEFPSIWMMKQVKDFKEQYNYTYTGMELTLKYWTETLGNNMNQAKGIGIIPYIYDEAKKFHIEKINVHNSLVEMDSPLVVEKRMEVKRSSIETNKTRKENTLFDMNDL